MATSVYPSLTGTRYEHALGTMHLAIQAWEQAWNRATRETQDRFFREVRTELQDHPAGMDDKSGGLLHLDCTKESFARQIAVVVGAVGLTHDIGHPPFSHALEHFYEDNAPAMLGSSVVAEWRSYQASVLSGRPQFHEFAGKRILDQVLERQDRLPTYLIRRVFGARGDAPFDWAAGLHGLIDGEFDVDRLDYLARDSGRAGTEFDAFDSARLLDSLELHHTKGWGWVFGLGLRARSAMETFLFQRAQAYVWMIFHSGVVASNAFLQRAVEELWRLSSDQSVSLAVRNAFGRIRPNLDYLSGHTVDDHTVYTWLKAGSETATSHLANGSGEPAALTMVRVLCEESLYHEPRYVPLWRTFDEQVEVCDELQRFNVSLNHFAHRLADRPLRDALQASTRDNWSGSAVDINGIIASHREQVADLERMLNEQYPRVDVLGDGRWVVAYTHLSPFSARRTFNHLFDGLKPVSLQDVSPVVRQLADICDERIKLHVFYLLSSDTRYFDEGRRKLHSVQLRQPFADVFRQWMDALARQIRAA
ncbi:hypothetical protein ACPCHT_37125 [Nucisporomicrobium flavum]|uniref:hypothetical protein n=1 Tax=Nucisporomicrobium flavum TaxID=2785915 RepID=UPI003C2BB049